VDELVDDEELLNASQALEGDYFIGFSLYALYMRCHSRLKLCI
jgi:hypothetical protein